MRAAFSLWTLLFVSLACAIPVAAEYERVQAPLPDDPMKVHIYKLDNGLTVFLSENHETPRFYAEISVRAGSKMDPADATGLAHYLEHLLFKGTSKLGTLNHEAEKAHLEQITELYEQHFAEEDPAKRREIYAEINRVSQEAAAVAIANEIDKVYNDMGGHALNAHTWHEETVYKVSLPSNRLEHWATIESERFRDPVFRLFHTELEAVYEEKNRALDSKERLIHDAVYAALFKQHPYGQQPTIGTTEHLKRPSLLKIRDYYNTFYVPNNMAISISGDIDPKATIELIDEHFSSWKSKPVPEVGEWNEPPISGREFVQVQYEGEEYVLLGFRTAPRGHDDEPALKLLDMILDNSVAGLINLNLVQQQRVRNAGSSPAFMNDHGIQHLYGVPKEGQTLEEVEQLLLDQIELVKKGEFDDWILPAIITDFKKNRKAGLESDMSRVMAMTDAFISHTDWRDAVGEIDEMEQVTKEDVVAAAKKYFGEDYVVGYRRDAQHEVPKIEKPQIDPVAIDPTRQSVFAKEIFALPYQPIEPEYIEPGEDYEREELRPGMDFYYAKNPLNDLFTLTITVEFGSHEDNKIAIATQLLDKSGTKALSAEDLKKEWYKIGANFGVSAGDNETYISISGLDENFERALELMMEILSNPQTDDATLEELKQIILVTRADAKKDPGMISTAMSHYVRYGDESYFLRMLPDVDVKALTVDELFDVTRNLLGYEQTISYVGSLPKKKVKNLLKEHHPAEGELKDPPPYRFLRARNPEKTQIFLFDKEMAQAQVRIEFPDAVYDAANETPIDLYNGYFAGGMSGVVFQELREARALAYSAGARYITGSRENDENLMVGVIGTQADKTVDAVEAFLDLFDNLPESPERFAEAVNALDNQYRTSRIDFRGVIGAVRSWERKGLEGDPRAKWFGELQDAELQTMLAFHREHIKGRPKLITIVGEKSRIDLERLEQIGDVTEIDVDTIFVD